MFEIKELLLPFEKILNSNELRLDQIRLILIKHLGVNIQREKIELKNNKIFLKLKPIFKNQILLKKDKIILDLEKELGKKYPKEIL
jgi:hypothetical protein